MEITGETRLLGLMGHPVRHSLSPKMHNASFASRSLDFVYVAMDVAPGKLKDAVGGAVALGYRGFNLTMPHKEEVIPLLDEIDGAAAVSGAVNTVVIEESGFLKGYNTDGYGMVAACREAGASIEGGSLALIGAGGAASAIALAMKRAGISEIHLFNRNRSRAEELAAKLAGAGEGEGVRVRPLSDLENFEFAVDMVVNATSLGMKEGDELPVPTSCFENLDSGRVVIADAVYHPGGRTKLLEVAEEAGVSTVTGQRMLLYQGVEAQRLWTGSEPDISVMDAALG